MNILSFESNVTVLMKAYENMLTSMSLNEVNSGINSSTYLNNKLRYNVLWLCRDWLADVDAMSFYDRYSLYVYREKLFTLSKFIFLKIVLLLL